MARILVIEDDTQLRELLCLFLRREGMDAVGADSGRTGLASFRREGADLVVTDIVMPDVEGIETIREIRRIDPSVPVIACSGGGRIGPESYLDLALRMGASRIFEKPLQLSGLLAAVRELLDGSAAGGGSVSSARRS